MMHGGIRILFLVLLFAGCGTMPHIPAETPPSTPHPQESESPPVEIDSYINPLNCDIVIVKRTMESDIDICYDYGYRSARYVYYGLDAAYIDEGNIQERPLYYPEPEIPERYRVQYHDYTRSGYDRGHIAPDADFDYDEEDLKKIYTLANIVPQDPYVNEYLWSDLEAYERRLTRAFGRLDVLTGIVFAPEPERIGDTGLAVPKGFWKILWNGERDFKECYYYDNFVLGDAAEDRFDLHKIPCSLLRE